MPLFDPLQLGPLAVPHRVVLAPLTRSRASDGHVPSKLAAEYYAQRATSGALLISEATPISPQAVGYIRVPGIWNDEQVAAWRVITDAVHAKGGVIFCQLWHVGRVSHRSLQPDGTLPVSASAISADAQAFTSEGPQAIPIPRALDEEEIRDIVNGFAEGARRAMDAGFDGVEIHGANGYLIEQFLFSGSNTRSDGYGGSVKKRARFLLEVVDAVVAAVPKGRVGLRLSPQGGFNDSHDGDPRETFAYVGEALKDKGLVYLHVVEAVTTPRDKQILPALRRAFSGVVIANAGYDKASAEAILERGDADMVAFGTSFLANPDLPARLRLDAPLNPPDTSTFYAGDAKGYTDYPLLPAPYRLGVAVQVEVESRYETYRRRMKPILATYGGRFALDARVSEWLEPADSQTDRLFQIAFPSREAADAFFTNTEYLAIRAEDFDASTGEVRVLGHFEVLNDS